MKLIFILFIQQYTNKLVISTTAKLSHKDEVNNNFAMIDLGWSIRYLLFFPINQKKIIKNLKISVREILRTNNYFNSL